MMCTAVEMNRHCECAVIMEWEITTATIMRMLVSCVLMASDIYRHVSIVVLLITTMGVPVISYFKV